MNKKPCKTNREFYLKNRKNRNLGLHKKQDVMDAAKIEQLNRVLEGAPSQYWDEVIEYARYLIYKSEKGEDIFTAYSKEEMLKRAKNAEADIEAGRTLKLVDFKKEIETWKAEQRATK